ncbi:MAG: sulfatase-like hydrolase/transferase, partial [Anaerolineaceae bacterium]|nr:sulfatase-like hydrolase/transferase [Anaerolineaceae bacterium]
MVKKIIRILFSAMFLVLTVLLVVMAIKPGAAVFFHKEKLDLDKVSLTDSQVIYPITLSSSYYDSDTLLVRENGVLLEPIRIKDLVNRDASVFAVEPNGDDNFILRLIPISGDPQNTDLTSFTILVRPIFVVHPMVKILAVIFCIGFVLTLVSVLANPDLRKKILSGVFGFLKIWDSPIEIVSVIKRKSNLLITVIIQAVYASFLFVFMEWLFFVTKPSFMDILTLGQKLGVLFGSSLFLWIAIVALILVIFLLDIINSLAITPFLRFTYSFPSAFVLACLALLMFDNFTYTVFSFGVSTTTSWLRVFYVIGFVVIFVLLLRSLSKNAVREGGKKQTKLRLLSAGGLLLVAVVFMIVQYAPIALQTTDDVTAEGVRTPNIILVSDDGINAENMSLYGYERETTPFLDSLASSSLLMLNNFTNANSSTASDTAMLTGKLPFDTGVMFSPNTLKGMDTLEHLPGILKKLGYRTMSIGVPKYVDMGAINFQNGFDSISGQTNGLSELVAFVSSYGYNDAAYFSQTVIGRVSDRLLHIFSIRNMDNAYLLVTDPAPISFWLNMSQAYSLLTENLTEANQVNQPLFAHIHLLTTHGPKFYPQEQFYSVGQEQDKNWMTDFYDDAILDYDHWLEDLATYLKNQGYYNDTLIVFYTDHGEQWSVDNRIPLMIHFPNGDYCGEIVANTQNLDIAPTILDYLGVDVPVWMTGDSLLTDLDRSRLIYSAKIISGAFSENGEAVDIDKSTVIQFDYISVTQCQYSYEIYLDTGAMIRKTIAGFVDPCEE